ncbi:MAG: DUF4920 domain-containing protein [bacterium]|nr:DUF4920 domain-containing protein [bacterium]
MKRVLFFTVIAICIAAVGITFAAEKKKVGNELSDIEPVQITKILEDPESFVGKTIKITGVVIDMCVKRGGWMDLAGGEEFTKFTADAKTADFKFPLDSKGKVAVVEGILTKITVSVEEQKERLGHEAEENGKEVDLSTITEPKVSYVLKAVGAEIIQ